MLLVEDDFSTRNALSQILALKGYDVLSSTTIAEAFTALPQQPAAVILDLMLPDGDGAAILEAIRRKNLTIPVIVTTGVNDVDRLNRVRALGATVVLRKPIDLDALLATLT